MTAIAIDTDGLVLHFIEDESITEGKSGRYECYMSAHIQIMTVQNASIPWYSYGISVGGQRHGHIRGKIDSRVCSKL